MDTLLLTAVLAIQISVAFADNSKLWICLLVHINKLRTSTTTVEKYRGKQNKTCFVYSWMPVDCNTFIKVAKQLACGWLFFFCTYSAVINVQ